MKGKKVIISGKGSPLMKAGMKTSSGGFKAGGAVEAAAPKAKKLKTGGAVEGKAAAPRLDKFARGGRAGGSPFSSGHGQSSRNNGGSSSGHENTPC
jgi:hypothetical protein